MIVMFLVLTLNNNGLLIWLKTKFAKLINRLIFINI